MTQMIKLLAPRPEVEVVKLSFGELMAMLAKS